MKTVKYTVRYQDNEGDVFRFEIHFTDGTFVFMGLPI